jgi:hypothetical protein
MDLSGAVHGAYDGSVNTEKRARLVVFGDRVLDKGRIAGKFKTGSDGTTKGAISIAGPGWSVRMTGPVDAAGFHATATIRGAGFSLRDVPSPCTVIPGPLAPPPPATDPYKRIRLVGATATRVGGQVTITSSSVPTKFFGAPAGLTITFPFADGVSVVHANPASASTATPRRCIVNVGRTVYGTALAPADVTLDVKSNGSRVGVLATGTVVSAAGKTKRVELFVEAAVE